MKENPLESTERALSALRGLGSLIGSKRELDGINGTELGNLLHLIQDGLSPAVTILKERSQLYDALARARDGRSGMA